MRQASSEDFKRLNGLGSELLCTGIGGLKGLYGIEIGFLCTGVGVSRFRVS